MKKLILVLSLFVFSACGLNPVHGPELLYEKADGTEPRVEREYKYSVKGVDLIKYDTKDLAEMVNEILKEAADNPEFWEVTKLLATDYYADEEAESYAYFDVYFDTEDNLAFNNSISYRLRERFKSLKKFKKFVEDQEDEDLWPFRIEFQAKTGREELGEGFSTVSEARFEFRKESKPFGELNPPPEPPWDLEEYIGYLESGRFEQYYTWPAKSVYTYLVPKIVNRDEIEFEPKLVLITDRQRQHLNIPTDFGSGPNPEQAFIVTLDTSYVYDAKDYLPYFRKKELGFEVDEPRLQGKFTEIEVEFERNISTDLDKAIETDQELVPLRDAFLADQKNIMTVLKDAFLDKGLILTPASESKYLQAYEIMEN